MHSQINFGYPWIFTYGHLFVAAPALAIFLVSWARKRNKVVLGVSGALALWALTAFAMLRFGFDMNGRATMPTQAFLTSGAAAKVLDMGAGTGRSTLMVLEARPQTTVVALDSFSDSYTEHFGNAKSGQTVEDRGRAKLIANMKAAGVEERATIQPGDMRHMPFEAGTFDAIVSAYAIDHLSREGSSQAIGEAYRVLKPHGEFLLMVIAKDLWLDLTYGPMLVHMRAAASGYWESRMRNAGFDIIESGHRPFTHYVVARKPGA